MPDVFVNYRTGDEESAATMIARELARRFGDERIFFASNSIEPGRRFPAELVRAVEECEALLAVIGPRWAEVRGADGRPALEAEQDWTRREIQTALDRGVLVIPVLVGKATRIDRSVLPDDLLELADCQYRRFDHRNAESDWRRSATPSPGSCPSWVRWTATPVRRGSGRRRSPASFWDTSHSPHRPAAPRAQDEDDEDRS